MNRSTIFLLLLATLGCGESAPQPPPPSASPPTPPTELAPVSTLAVSPSPSTGTTSLDGKWIVTSLLKSGMESLPAGTLVLEFRNGRQIMTLNGQIIDDVEIRFDPAAVPMQLDTIHPGPGGSKVTNEGLIEIMGETMQICVAAGKPRPPELSSTADNGYNLTVLKKSP